MRVSILFAMLAAVFLAAGCTKHELPREVPSSPPESYRPLPK